MEALNHWPIASAPGHCQRHEPDCRDCPTARSCWARVDAGEHFYMGRVLTKGLALLDTGQHLIGKATACAEDKGYRRPLLSTVPF